MKMKNYLLLLLIAFSGIIKAQSKKITFEYDAAGNQIKRELCINCPSKNLEEEEEIKEITTLKEEDLEKFAPGDVLSYYPNPVREELYLQWETAQDNFVKSIQVYGLEGRAVTAYAHLDRINNQIIPFQAYPAGVYLVVLEYNNKEQKTIKIIKQK